MYYFYVLYSLKDGKLYKGYTSNLGNRFIKHSFGGVKSTKYRRPLVLIYAEAFHSKREALARERWVKTAEGASNLIQLLKDRMILSPDLHLKL